MLEVSKMVARAAAERLKSDKAQALKEVGEMYDAMIAEAEARAGGTIAGRAAQQKPAKKNGPKRRRRARAGSIPDKVADILREMGRPMHINDLETLLEKDKGSFAGSLNYAVKRGTLTRPAPSTYGLPEWEGTQANAQSAMLSGRDGES